MNARRRVLVITRHFWPATNDDTLRLYHWTQHLVRDGAQVTVATPRWHSSWPRRLVCDDVVVERIDSPPLHSLRWSSYTRQFEQWLSRAGEFDVYYCDSPEAEGDVVLDQATRQGAPLMVRYHAGPQTASPSARQLNLCRRASLVVVGSLPAQQQLLAAGIAPRCIWRGPQVAGARYDRRPEARRTARQVLAEANHDLFARGQDRVLVCPGELTEAWQLPNLLRQLAPLIDSHRSLRVWLLGDGRQRHSLYQALRHDGLHRLVALPGIFTDLEEVLQAADLCLLPAAGIGLGWLLPTCIASGLPVLVADSPEARRLLGATPQMMTVSDDEPQAWRQRVGQWLHDPLPLTRHAAELQRQNPAHSASYLTSQVVFDLQQTCVERHA